MIDYLLQITSKFIHYSCEVIQKKTARHKHQDRHGDNGTDAGTTEQDKNTMPPLQHKLWRHKKLESLGCPTVKPQDPIRIFLHMVPG